MTNERTKQQAFFLGWDGGRLWIYDALASPRQILSFGECEMETKIYDRDSTSLQSRQ